MGKGKVSRRASDDHNSDTVHRLGFAAPDADKAVCRRAPVTAFPRACLREHTSSKAAVDLSENVQPLPSKTEPLASEAHAAAAFSCSVLPRGPCATFGNAPRPCAYRARQKLEEKRSEITLLPSRYVGPSPDGHPASEDGHHQTAHTAVTFNSSSTSKTPDADASPSHVGSPGTEDEARSLRDSGSRYSDTVVQAPETCAPEPQPPLRAPTVDARTKTTYAAPADPNSPSTALLPRHGCAIFGSAPRWKASTDRHALQGPPHQETRPVTFKREAPVPPGAQYTSHRVIECTSFIAHSFTQTSGIQLISR